MKINKKILTKITIKDLDIAEFSKNLDISTTKIFHTHIVIAIKYDIKES